MGPQYSTLVLAPHIDDEVLGCFSFLNKDTFVYCFGAEERKNASRAERIKELENAAHKMGFCWDVGDNTCQQYQCFPLIGEIESLINELKPETLLVPPFDYNQDHRAVYDAALAATRPHDLNWQVPRLLVYELPGTVLWPYERVTFEPNLFRQIDINAKIDTYKIYSSQVREHRSPELLTSLAKLRGAAVNISFAEAFYCKRQIERL
jgi:LmbE family N-acetylglucosaminyl deacetylase